MPIATRNAKEFDGIASSTDRSASAGSRGHKVGLLNSRAGGFGREMSRYALDSYTQVKTV